MKRGLYRIDIPGRGKCARVHWLAGDAAPHLDQMIYDALGFEPPFALLPPREEFRRAHPWMADDAIATCEDLAACQPAGFVVP